MQVGTLARPDELLAVAGKSKADHIAGIGDPMQLAFLGCEDVGSATGGDSNECDIVRVWQPEHLRSTEAGRHMHSMRDPALAEVVPDDLIGSAHPAVECGEPASVLAPGHGKAVVRTYLDRPTL